MQKKSQHDHKNIKQKNLFANMGLPHLQMMAATIQEIHDVCVIRGMSHVTVTSFDDDPLRNILARNEVIEFLIKGKIIEVCLKKKKNSYSRWDIKVVAQKTLAKYSKQLKAAMSLCAQPKGNSLPDNSVAKRKSSGPFVQCSPGTKWSDIEFEFLDEQRVLIKIGRIHGRYNFAKLGFSDDRTSEPNKQWKLLNLLARLQGKLTWDDSEATSQKKKIKSLLSKALRNCFGIDDDPFHPYKEAGTYQLKFKKITSS